MDAPCSERIFGSLIRFAPVMIEALGLMPWRRISPRVNVGVSHRTCTQKLKWAFATDAARAAERK